MIDPVSSSYSAINCSSCYAPPALTQSQNEFIATLLADYDPARLTSEDIQEINDAFRDEGIVPSRDLREAIEEAGFDPEDLRNGGGSEGGHPPPPPPPDEQAKEQLDALIGILETYNATQLNASAISDIREKMAEAGYASDGHFLSITV